MWISAKDQLPEPEREVVFQTISGRSRYIGRFNGERQKFIPYGEYSGFYDVEVLAWFEVPKQTVILSET